MSQTLESDVLDRICDDYETAHTIAQDLSRDLGRSVGEGEVLSALLALAESGLAQAFVYDQSSGQYRSIDSSKVQSKADLWFIAAPAREAE